MPAGPPSGWDESAAPDGGPAPPLTSRVELRLGLAFWVIAGTTASLLGAFWEYAPYAALVLGIVLTWPIFRRRLPFAPFLLDWLPLPLVVFTYDMLHAAVPCCWRETIDGPLAAIDRAVLGDHVGVLLEPVVSHATTVVMSVCYASYYPLTVSVAVWLYATGRRAPFREYCAGAIGSLFLGFLGYLFLPAMGPHAWLPADTWTVPLDGNFITPLIRSLNDRFAGAFPRDAFPSLHTANAVTVLLVTWRHHRRAFGIYLVPCLGLILATMYLRWHYAVDVLAGAALAIVWQRFVPAIVAREVPPAQAPAAPQ